MKMTNLDAGEIASLINDRNQLARGYSVESILEHEDEYIFRKGGTENQIIACVQVKKVQWYQTEILHLSVHANHGRQGHAKYLIGQAISRSSELGARLMQCTIRENNWASRTLFESYGFVCVGKFLNRDTGNNICVYQLVLAKPDIYRLAK
jgi:ribosomal protein S18 acetylase RimI-like enzyme